MVGALEAMRDRDVPRSQIDQPPGNEEWRYLAWPALLQQQRGIGNAGEAADPGPDHGAGGALFLFGRRVPIGIIERLTRRAHGEDDEIVDLALVLRLHPLVGIEGAGGAVAARDHAGDSAGQIGDVEGVDLPGAALAVEDAFPGRLDATAEWRNHAEARDDNPPHILALQLGIRRPQQETGGPFDNGPSGFVSTARGVSFSRSFREILWRRRRSKSFPRRRREFRNRIPLRTPSRARR